MGGESIMDDRDNLKDIKCLECGKVGTLAYLGQGEAFCKECGERYECEGLIEVIKPPTTLN